MSLITRCPICGTMFKVVADQLRISEGWVRCGNCAEIFDATANLQEPPAGASAAAEAESEAVPPPSVPARAAPAQASPGAQGTLEARSTGLESDPIAAAPPPPTQASLPAVAAPIASVRTAPAVARGPEPPDSVDPPPLYPWFPSEVRDSQLQREDRDEEPDLDDVPFVRKARRRAFWRRPLVRTLLLLLLLMLAGLLALQYALYDRDRLAAARPALRPWLQMLCEPLRCQIGAPRQIDTIVIDSSSFSRLRNDAYRLSFTLRNQAPTQVAMPSIELTLTDTQDQPVIRRVLAPRDLGAAAVLAASSEATESVSIAVSNSGGNRIAGYRLLAFYP